MTIKPTPRITEQNDELPATLAAFVERVLKDYFAAHGTSLPPKGLYDRILHEVEKPLLAVCLEAVAGNQLKAAEVLGLNRNTLHKKMRLLKVKRPQSPRKNRRWKQEANDNAG